MIATIGILCKGAGTAYDPDAQAYFTACEGQGYTFPVGWKIAFNDWYVGVKADGLVFGTDIYEAFYYAHGNTDANKVRMVTPAGAFATFVGSPTHGANGIVTNGTSSYINTGIAPNIATQNSIGVAVYIQTAPAANVNARVYWGSLTGNTLVYLNRVDLDVNYAVNGLNNNGTIAAATNSDKFLHTIRTASNTTTLYRNGTSIGSYAGSSSSTTNSFPIFIGCRNSAGTAINFSALTASFFVFTNGLDSTKAAALSSRTITLLTATAGA